MYPSAEKPYSGIYVKNIYESLHAQTGVFERLSILTMKRQFTSGAGSILKYAKLVFESRHYIFSRFDILHLHFFYPLILWAAAYKLLHPSCKLVVTCHGSDINANFNSSMSRRIYSMLVRKTVDKIVVVGPQLSYALKEKLGYDADFELCAGVDRSLFYQDETITKKYDLLFVGSFTEQKGIDLLLGALSQYEVPLRICFVGSGDMEKQIKELDTVHRLQVINNLPQAQLRTIYSESKFLILPSRMDAFGLVVTESMYCGTPVIAADLLGFRKQIADGENGYIVKEASIDSILVTIKQALHLSRVLYRQMSDNALNSNDENSLEKITQQYQEIYSDLLLVK